MMKSCICINCEKQFARPDSLRRHQKHSCKKTSNVQPTDDQTTLKCCTTLKQVNKPKVIKGEKEEDILRLHQKYGCRKVSNKQTLEEQLNLDDDTDGGWRGSEQEVEIYNDWREVQQEVGEDVPGFRNC